RPPTGRWEAGAGRAAPPGPAGPPPASHRPVGGLRGAPSPQPAWSTPAPASAVRSGPPGAPGAGGAPAPGPGKPRRGRLLAGTAFVAVLFLVLGAGGTYVALDRLGMLAAPADDLQAGPAPAAEPSAAGDERPAGGPAASPSPSAGEAPSGQREDPDELRLASEEPVNETTDYRSTLATVNAEDYDEALSVEASCGDYTAEYNLGRDYEGFAAVVGLGDDSPRGEATFTVIGDGKQLETKTLGLGEDADLEVDVTSVLRLELVTEVECSSGAVAAVWAEPVVSR
ncbi:NPCBM/NEW2 domain-containing protein, partial [Nocardiopsis mangrovi]